MKALVVYGSPRHKKAASYRIGHRFAEGLERAGVDVDEIILSKQTIKHCIGCYTCWTKTPGKCIHKDDMAENLPKLQKANLVVYTTPLYIYSVTGIMKDFMDRSIPIAEPWLLTTDKGHSTHPLRGAPIERKVFLISVCGFPEPTHFDSLVTYFRKISGENYIGEILIPASEPMSMDNMQGNYNELYDHMELAGFDLGKDGYVSDKTKQLIKEDTTYTEGQLEAFRDLANRYWGSLRPKDYSQVKLETVEEVPLKPTDDGEWVKFFAKMAERYNPEAIPGLKGVMQFNLDDERYYLVINETVCKAYKGEYPDPSLTVISPSDVWMKISKGDLDGAKSMMQGLYTMQGDMKLLIKLGKIFSKRD